MAILKFCIVIVVAAFCYFTIIDSAAATGEVARRLKRNALDDDLKSEYDNVICHEEQPCGWLVYDPVTKLINNGVQNSCRCSEPKPYCVQTNEDKSSSAHVFHCRQNMTIVDVEFPKNK